MVRETVVQSYVEPYQRLKNGTCCPLNSQHHKVKIKGKWSDPGRGVSSSPIPRCSSTLKRKPSGCLRLTSTHLQTYIRIYIYIYIYIIHRNQLKLRYSKKQERIFPNFLVHQLVSHMNVVMDKIILCTILRWPVNLADKVRKKSSSLPLDIWISNWG